MQTCQTIERSIKLFLLFAINDMSIADTYILSPRPTGTHVQSIGEVSCLQRAQRILTDDTHPSHSLFTMLQYLLLYQQTTEQLHSLG